MFNKCNYSDLFNSPVQIRIKYILRCIVIKAAVEILNFVADKGIICCKKCINNVHIFFFSNAKNKSFIYFTNVPVTWNRIFCSRDVVKISLCNSGRFDKIITDTVDIVAVVNISQFIYFGNRDFAECIYYG